MEELLNNILSNSSLPPVSAFVLGLMTAISPCPLATNITAIGYISKDLKGKSKVFYRGLVYTLGRMVAYTFVALILYLGADQLKITGFFQQYGEKLIGPFLLVLGILMLGIFNIKLPFSGRFLNSNENKEVRSWWDVFMLGVLFALAFCPYSGVLYFGMLIPLSISSASGLYLPSVFAIATGIPVIIFAWLIAFTLSGVGSLYNSLRSFERWFRKIVAVLFIGAGLYYIIIVFF